MLFTFIIPVFAQTVTEKYLLGTWGLSAFEMDGIASNFKTGEITLSQKAKEKYGDKAEAFRVMMEEEIKADNSKRQELAFENEATVIFRKGEGEDMTWRFSIVEKEGIQYLRMNGGAFKMTLIGNELVLSGAEDGIEIIMTYEKAQ